MLKLHQILDLFYYMIMQFDFCDNFRLYRIFHPDILPDFPPCFSCLTCFLLCCICTCAS